MEFAHDGRVTGGVDQRVEDEGDDKSADQANGSRYKLSLLPGGGLTRDAKRV